MNSEVLFYLTIIGVAVFVLVRSSYYVVRSISAIGRYLRFSDFLISFLLLSLATSMSELSVGINAALTHTSELSLGDVLGTNIVNMTLIFGLITVIGGGIVLRDYDQFKQTRIETLILISAPFLLLLDGNLGRFDGLILLSLFVFHIYRISQDREEFVKKKTFKHSMVPHVYHTAASKRQFIGRIVTFVVSVSLLLASAYATVVAVTKLSAVFGISEFIFGLFVVAIGTSLPELIVGLRSIRTNKESISVGNLFGAITINSTLVLGLVSLINPIDITDIAQYAVTVGLTLLTVLVIFGMLAKKHTVARWQGFLFLGAYLLFLGLQFLFA